jgi:anti-anti-sigma factor
MEERFERERSLRLMVIGELDIAVVPLLSSRLRELRKEGYHVCLDMSQLTFIDSSGIHEILRQVGESRRDGWDLVLDGPLTAPVARTVDLAGARDYLWPDER